jgi:tRNA pseudouridine38-40 synthase
MRIRLTVSYRGSRYAGWQVQRDAPTIQGELQAVVSRLMGREVAVTGASRTDAGVHAVGQVCHFDAPRELPLPRWMRAFARLLPEDIRVLDCRPADADFHARFSALRKTYLYHVDPAPIASPFLSPFSWHRPRITDFEEMTRAAAFLQGPVHQRAFASRPEGDRDLRGIESFTVDAGARLVTFTVVGRSFLRHAVRGMVGTLLEVGYGRRSADSVRSMATAAADHPLMVKAPAHGLCLLRVDY